MKRMFVLCVFTVLGCGLNGSAEPEPVLEINYQAPVGNVQVDAGHSGSLDSGTTAPLVIADSNPPKLADTGLGKCDKDSGKCTFDPDDKDHKHKMHKKDHKAGCDQDQDDDNDQKDEK